MTDAPEIFLNEEEIVTDMLLYRLVEREKMALRSIPAGEVKDLCGELCTIVVSHYRLDDKNNPYTDKATTSNNSPVKISQRAVEKVWSRLTGKTIPSPVEVVDITYSY